ncbi:DUF928 domain-containing protein [Scytonema sp. UIC 10036]|uniref:DUF928 domain-containing protein n=1 Tax=Scytonema sp. UIC 10036 TaxID=2304196 RepID=UPI0012DA51C5|nr:DUF928 domain-containing protein [Scytonema sp. UIC 10036]MUG93687.1 DUF928 domain-containing protein [Scytonema sp. UIC 10036]
MKWIQACLCLAAFSLPICWNFIPVSALTPHKQDDHTPKTWQMSQVFKPPKRGKPPASAGGSTRSSSCFKGNKRLTPLIPSDKLGLTLAKHPTFFWYVPSTSVKTAKFLLLADGDREVLYETVFTLPNEPGIISFKIPNSAPALAIGKTYHWYFTIVCNAEDTSDNPLVDGWIERTQAELPLSQALAKADLWKLPALYAEAGIWHEGLTALVQLRRTEPRSLKVKMDWRQFLKSVGLNAIVSEPSIDCCTADNSLPK